MFSYAFKPEFDAAASSSDPWGGSIVTTVRRAQKVNKSPTDMHPRNIPVVLSMRLLSDDRSIIVGCVCQVIKYVEIQTSRFSSREKLAYWCVLCARSERGQTSFVPGHKANNDPHSHQVPAYHALPTGTGAKAITCVGQNCKGEKCDASTSHNTQQPKVESCIAPDRMRTCSLFIVLLNISHSDIANGHKEKLYVWFCWAHVGGDAFI